MRLYTQDQYVPECGEADRRHLLAWRNLVISEIHKTPYVSYAEDVAQDVALALIKRFAQGIPIHPCPERLSRTFRQEVLRRAHRISRESFQTKTIEQEPSTDPAQTTDDSPNVGKLLKRLEDEFSETQIASMLQCARSGRTLIRDFSEASGIPDRTFRYKRHKLRGGCN